MTEEGRKWQESGRRKEELEEGAKRSEKVSGSVLLGERGGEKTAERGIEKRRERESRKR
jgi:hypothetical protein